METTTTRPPATSPGDGRSESNVSKRSSARPVLDAPHPGYEEKAPAGPAPEGRELLGADGSPIPVTGHRGSVNNAPGRTLPSGRELGRRAGESWKRLSKAAENVAEKNPSRAALGALGLGFVAGVVIGAILARD